MLSDRELLRQLDQYVDAADGDTDLREILRTVIAFAERLLTKHMQLQSRVDAAEARELWRERKTAPDPNARCACGHDAFQHENGRCVVFPLHATRRCPCSCFEDLRAITEALS